MLILTGAKVLGLSLNKHEKFFLDAISQLILSCYAKLSKYFYFLPFLSEALST